MKNMQIGFLALAFAAVIAITAGTVLAFTQPWSQNSVTESTEPSLTEDEVIAVAKYELRWRVSEDPSLRTMLYSNIWSAEHMGQGKWRVTGIGEWFYYEKTDTFEPIDGKAMEIMLNSF